MTDHGGRVGDRQPAPTGLEHVCATAVRSLHLPPGDRNAVELHLEVLVDPLAAGGRDLQCDLGGIADRELEPGGYGTSHGR